MARLLRFLLKWAFRAVLLVLVLVAMIRWIAPPITPYSFGELRRLGSVERDWVAIETIPRPVLAAFVAAEDARFCLHRGIDVEAIRQVLDTGASGGASTITQQTAKNVFLWQGRSWLRKGLEAAFAGYIELVWGKPRILEIYLNVAEFDEGVFGIEAGSQAYFEKAAADLSLAEAARLASVLPNPKGRSAAVPNANQLRRIPTITAGATAILGDRRSGCFNAPDPSPT